MLNDFRFGVISLSGKGIVIDPFDPTYVLVDDRFIIKEMKEKMIRVSIIKDTILIVKDHPELHRQGRTWEDPPVQVGNIFAIDTTGTVLWKIEDLIPEFRMPFCGLYVVSEKDKQEAGTIFGASYFEGGHDFCVCFNDYSEYFLIDLTEPRFVRKVVLKM